MENMTVRETAEMLQVSVQAVSDLVRRGKLEVDTTASPQEIVGESLEAWIAYRDAKRARIHERVLRQAVREGLVTQ